MQLISLIPEQKNSLKIIKTTFIRSVVVLESKNNVKKNLQSVMKQDPKLRPVNPEQLKVPKHRELRYKHNYELNRIIKPRIGQVSKEGLEIFKELYNLLPKGDVSWKKDDIVIYDDSVRITSPYKTDNVVCAHLGDDSQLEFIKKVIEKVWQASLPSSS
ncbi:BA75_02249T0 [Komagataella pastoris]|uniref:BA75_02249T0 n=1 Tax=Komagataella pastoris TaxID=4922 RepID=A0A1B2JDC8_PICPA|nr:BA75_02249T0 [Komagataella pastoris]